MKFTELYGGNLLVKLIDDKSVIGGKIALSKAAREQVLAEMPVITGIVVKAGPGDRGPKGDIIPNSAKEGDCVAFPPNVPGMGGGYVPIRDDAYPDDDIVLIPDSALIGLCEINPQPVPAVN